MIKTKAKNLDYISSSLVILNGLICIIYGDKLMPLLPIICGTILLTKGIIQLIEGIASKDYCSLEKIKMEQSFIAIAIGLGVLIKRRDALFIVGIFWGLSGLVKSASYLNVALYKLFNKDKWILILAKAIVQFSLSLVLIFDPFGKLGHHIIILGIELVFDGTMEIINTRSKTKKLLTQSI